MRAWYVWCGGGGGGNVPHGDLHGAESGWRRRQLSRREAKESAAETTAKEEGATNPTAINDAAEDMVANVAQFMAQFVLLTLAAGTKRGNWWDQRKGQRDTTIIPGVGQDSARICPFSVISRSCYYYYCWLYWLLMPTLVFSDALTLFSLVIMSLFL